MELDMGMLMSAMLIGAVGMGLFIYGKKQTNIQVLALGLAFMVYPYFVHSVLWMWVIAVAAIAGIYALARFSSSGTV